MKFVVVVFCAAIVAANAQLSGIGSALGSGLGGVAGGLGSGVGGALKGIGGGVGGALTGVGNGVGSVGGATGTTLGSTLGGLISSIPSGVIVPAIVGVLANSSFSWLGIVIELIFSPITVAIRVVVFLVKGLLSLLGLLYRIIY